MLVIEADDLAKALIDAISEHGITRLVMGAASGDNDYTKYGQGFITKKLYSARLIDNRCIFLSSAKGW